MTMTDHEIIKGLIDKDNHVTEDFFFVRCRPLFLSIMHSVFSYEVDYDEFVNELYQYLMENDAAKLYGFQYRCSIYQWLKILAIRYFIKKRDGLIDANSRESLYEKHQNRAIDTEREVSAKMDLERFFEKMQNKRYVYVIRKLILEDIEPEQLALEIGVTTANLYNIKKRAMAALTRIALEDINNKRSQTTKTNDYGKY